MKNNPKDKKTNKWIKLGLLFIIAALVLIFYNFFQSYSAKKSSENAIDDLENKILENSENVKRKGDDIDLRDVSMPIIEIDGFNYIGYLIISSKNLKLPVMESWDYDRLKIAPCRYSGSIYEDNLVIAGHNYRSHFGPLANMNKGDKIDFVDAEGIIYNFEVLDIEILEPTQIENLVSEDGDWDLTMFTCTLGGMTRYAIRCIKIDK